MLSFKVLSKKGGCIQILKFTYKLFPDWVQWLGLVPNHRVQKDKTGSCRYSLEQVIFCGLMLFILRHRSLRSFVLETRGNSVALRNFTRWIAISEVPSDDDLRYCLSTISTKTMNALLKKFHAQIDRRKLLANEARLAGLELVALDGTGQLSSTKISCEKCLTREPSTGDKLHMHGQLLASITNLRATYAPPTRCRCNLNRLNAATL